MALTFNEFMELIVTPITILVGLLGNVASIIVLRDGEIQLRRSFARLLIALAVFDTTFIASTSFLFTLSTFSDYYDQYIFPHITPVMLPMASISMMASVYSTVSICLDRYIAICRPALLGCCGGSGEATSWAMIVGTVVISILYNIPKFFEYRTVMIDGFGAVNEPTDLRTSKFYVFYYILVSNSIFMGALPMLTMIILNILVIKEVNKANKQRDTLTERQQRTTTVAAMLMAIVLVFVICHSVRFFLNIYEVFNGYQHLPILIDYLISVSHWLLILNSSVNMFIYLHKDPRFRTVFKRKVMRLLRIPLNEASNPELELVTRQTLMSVSQDEVEVNGESHL